MRNSLAVQVRKSNENLYVEIPKELVEYLSLKPGDYLEFSISKSIAILKSRNLDVPNEVFLPLLELFKTENHAFQWLNKKQHFFSGKAPIELLNEPGGKDQVLDLINRIRLGDFS